MRVRVLIGKLSTYMCIFLRKWIINLVNTCNNEWVVVNDRRVLH